MVIKKILAHHTYLDIQLGSLIMCFCMCAMAAETKADKLAEFKPYVPPETTIPELTIRAILLGAALGLVFGAASVYLGLRVGITTSASIPIAVMSITILKLLGKSTILENNIVQTVGSAGESIAAAVVFYSTSTDLPWLCTRCEIDFIACNDRRIIRRIDDDSSAPVFDCERAWQSSFSGRNCMRRNFESR